jgi:hypothetical protein
VSSRRTGARPALRSAAVSRPAAIRSKIALFEGRRMSEYDPVFGGGAGDREPGASDLVTVRELFAAASRPYLSSALPWLCWAILLPSAALLTDRAVDRAGAPGVLGLWSGTILLGGAAEMLFVYRSRRRVGRGSPLSSWAMTLQGNLSLVAVALSVALVLAERTNLLPGLWLLVLGHSLFTLGSLAFRPQRTAGIVYQLGGVAALVPGVPALWVFAAATALGNLWIAVGIARRG